MKTMTITIAPEGFRQAYKLLSGLRAEMPGAVQSVSFGEGEPIVIAGEAEGIRAVLADLNAHLQED